ncbi:DUF7344 domain-containing protein [Halovivax gelatinilyticus]|uniref:DUF7344 domain-containing protein n=1 Tax=Halovivax gelatinilyticus TaxID=2961597 RepID=UPI0020CA87E5|nr:hypothetical protein [Halovivax gelatinilyticus]
MSDPDFTRPITVTPTWPHDDRSPRRNSRLSRPPDRPPHNTSNDDPNRGDPGRDEGYSATGRSRPDAAQPTSDESGGAFTSGPGESAHPVATSELFDLLSNAERRVLCAMLCDVTGEVSVESLATELARRTRADGRDRAVRSASISLVHNHLPHLAALDLIEFDRERHRVEPTETYRRIESPLRTLIDAGATLVSDGG